MEQFIIAGHKTEYHVRGELLRERSAPYKAEFDSNEAEIRLNIKEEFFQKKKVDFAKACQTELLCRNRLLANPMGSCCQNPGLPGRAIACGTGEKAGEESEKNLSFSTV